MITSWLNDRKPRLPELIWKGTPSQWLNVPSFLLHLTLAIIVLMLGKWLTHQIPSVSPEHIVLVSIVLAAIVLLKALYQFIETFCHQYTIRNDQILEERGVFTKRTDTLEMFRVKDVTIVQPFLLRLFGLGVVQLDTSDHSTPIVTLNAIPAPQQLADNIRNLVNKQREAKGVREFD